MYFWALQCGLVHDPEQQRKVVVKAEKGHQDQRRERARDMIDTGLIIGSTFTTAFFLFHPSE